MVWYGLVCQSTPSWAGDDRLEEYEYEYLTGPVPFRVKSGSYTAWEAGTVLSLFANFKLRQGRVEL